MWRLDIDTTPTLTDLAAAGLIPAKAVAVFDGEGCRTVGDIGYRGKRWLRTQPGIGPRTIKALETALARDGLWLAP